LAAAKSDARVVFYDAIPANTPEESKRLVSLPEASYFGWRFLCDEADKTSESSKKQIIGRI
jgi:hypothetical protein